MNSKTLSVFLLFLFLFGCSQLEVEGEPVASNVTLNTSNDLVVEDTPPFPPDFDTAGDSGLPPLPP